MKTAVFLVGLIMVVSMFAESSKSIQLDPPDLTRGVPVMQALSQRASTREFDPKPLSQRDLSDLLWAANGINRPEEGKRTAPSAMNSQDIDVYVLTESASYLYDAVKNSLEHVADGDLRPYVAGRQEVVATAPVILLLVSDISRFQRGEEEQKMIWAAEDAGIVSQNISIFCASEGLATVVRASMDREKLSETLGLSETQQTMLNHPVSYMKE
jgi:nitroreductase